MPLWSLQSNVIHASLQERTPLAPMTLEVTTLLVRNAVGLALLTSPHCEANLEVQSPSVSVWTMVDIGKGTLITPRCAYIQIAHNKAPRVRMNASIHENRNRSQAINFANLV